MKKLIWFTTISILFLLFIVPGIMASFIDMVPAGDQPGYNYDLRLSIYKEREFIQKFVSRERNLVAVATSIRNPNLKNKKDIIFNLYDENNNLIRTSTLNGQNIEDGDFVKFVFDKISDSLDKTYSFTLSSPAAGQEEIIEVFIIEPTEDIIQFSYDKKTNPGGVPLVTFHKPSSHWEIIKKVYVNWFSRLGSCNQ